MANAKSRHTFFQLVKKDRKTTEYLVEEVKKGCVSLPVNTARSQCRNRILDDGQRANAASTQTTRKIKSHKTQRRREKRYERSAITSLFRVTVA